MALLMVVVQDGEQEGSIWIILDTTKLKKENNNNIDEYFIMKERIIKNQNRNRLIYNN